METIKGAVKRVIFSNEESGFKVMKVRIPSGPVLTLTGEFGPDIIKGTVADFHGDYRTHPKYGTNFRVSSYDIFHNAEELASIRLFIDAIAPNIGPGRACAIVDQFGNDVIGILEDAPHRLLEVEGIGSVSAESLGKAWKENKHKWQEERQEYTLRAFLNSLGIKERRVKKILKFFGGSMKAEETVRENPYKLTEIEGFGFSTADFVAKQLGVLESDPLRLKAFVYYAINVLCPRNGHLYLSVENCVEMINKYSVETNTYFIAKRTIIQSYLTEPLQSLTDEGLILVDDGCLYSVKCFNAEAVSASKIIAILRKESDLILLKRAYVDEHIANFERENLITLSDEQRDALYFFVEKKVYAITGSPGTGKTTVLKAIVSLVKKLQLDLTCMTPTGISAKKMEQTIDYHAYTIHRCLGFRGKEWRFGDLEKYETDVVIIDEACLPYKQFINLADGSKQYIGTIVNQKLPLKVLSYNTDKKVIESKRITNWFKYPYKNPLYKIKLSRANNRERQRILRCTGNHKIYTEQGEKRASEINKGDNVLIKGVFLNSFQKSFLMGSILGDAHIKKENSGKNISFVHGQSQKEYLFLKSHLFNCSEPYQCRGSFIPEKKLWRCTSRVIDDLDEIYKYTYPKGKRSITKKLLNQLDEIGLAVWYMDNGSLTSQRKRSYTALLHTEGFTKKECNLIVNWFKKKWNINSSVYLNKKYYLIRLTCESAIKFWKLILPWVIPSMAYKFPSGYTPNFKLQKQEYIETAPYPVQSISKYEPKGNNRKFIYDISVKDNCNYFSNGVLISNSMVDQEVFYRLLSALRDRVHLIFVGDNNQLPSVGAGNVLKELITCGEIPVINLEKIFRQDEASDIIKVAHKIKNGETDLSLFKPDPKADVFFVREMDIATIEQFVIKLAQKFKDERRLFQIITPRRDGPLSVGVLNQNLQKVLNAPSQDKKEINCGKFILRKGDRIIVIKNDYENDIFNGEVGKIIGISSEKIEIKIDERFISIPIEDIINKIQLAYSLTVHKCLCGQSLVFSQTGLTKLQEIKEKTSVLTRDMSYQNILWQGSTGIKETLKITTSFGYCIYSSLHHKFLSADEKKEHFIKASELKMNQYLCISRHLIPGHRIKLSWENKKPYKSGKSTRKPLNLPDYLTEDISWMLGVLVGDGYYNINKNGMISLGKPSSPEILSHFRLIIRNMGLHTTDRKRDNKICVIEVTSKNLREWLISIGLDYAKAEFKKIPKLILEASIKCRYAFISGLVDSDGSISNRRIRITSISLDLISELQILLLSLGITSKVSREKRSSNSKSFNKKPLYLISIFGRNNEIIKKNLKLHHIKKKKNIQRITSNKAFYEIVPCIKPVLDQIPFDRIKERDKNLLSQLKEVGHGRKRLSYNLLNKFNIFLKKNDINISLINKILKNNYFYDSIISIERVENREMCDLKINKEPSYIANGFICHNSQGQEYPYIILPFINQFGRNMLQRNLLYTAITRAKTKVIIIGHGSALEKAIDNSSVQKRNTKLGERIIGCLQRAKRDSLPIQLGELADYLPAPDNGGQSSSMEDTFSLPDITEEF